VRILTFTSLFPDSTRPNFCIFIYQRMAHVARRKGNSVTVVAPVPYVPGWFPGKKASDYRSIPAQEVFGELTVYHPRYPFIPKVSSWVHGFLMFFGSHRLVSRLAKLGVDCIDSHFIYPDGFAAVLLGKRLKIPVIVSARGTDINFYPNLMIVRSFLNWTLRNAQGRIGVCKALSEAMVNLGAPVARTETIGNGVDAGRFYPIDKMTARETLQIQGAEKIIVSVGALRRHKGHHLLISAVADLRRQGVAARLYIAGEGDARPALEKQVADLGLQEAVVLLGTVPNERLAAWYSAADVSCLASSREGWANVLLESMACGTPVVATRIWGTPEVVISVELGLLVEQTVESIANGLRDALCRQWDRRKLADHASAQSWEKVADRVEDCLRRYSST
jgi:teichuronic acid biosynthesis glycosyltransferase TuaC